jgi:uncharacterized protein VirK/YbjX
MITARLSVNSLWKLAGERAAWSPSRLLVRVQKLCLAAGHPIRHGRIYAVLGHPSYAALRSAYPRTPFKYLERDYLFRGLTLAERADCLLLHHRKLLEKLPDRFLRRLPGRDADLLKFEDELSRYSVTMGLPGLFQDEGELSLNLEVDGERVFVLSFTVIPGRVVQSDATDVLLVTRLQGEPGRSEQIRQATKAMHSVGPPALLLAALQGIAEAWEIREMAGVPARRLRSYEEQYAAHLTATYDDFFLELGVVQNEAGFFVSPIPLPQKPMREIKAGHKLRTKAKRAFKLQIAQEMAVFLKELN